MKNEFTPETRDLFAWNDECWYCNQNHVDCLHHILGRTSNSPLNAAPINNFDCHIGNGLLSTFETKKYMLNRTLNYLLNNEYQLTEEDKKFLKKQKKYYNSILGLTN